MITQDDCTRCGACCFGSHARYIALLPEDRARAIPEATTTEIDGRRYMTLADGHCAQLTRTEDAQLVCAIYPVRPEACRAFRPGSFECLKARQHRLALAEWMRAPDLVPDSPPILVPDVQTPPAMPGVPQIAPGAEAGEPPPALA
jgi:Fe-S-cluster containining protein